VQTQSQIPVGELRCRVDPINENETKHLMQFCFPTLFPDGYGGYKSLEEESRLHDHGLSDFCAHLMKWHDRRFIIHGNFKFFCLNLIQRRQIDGLVKRVAVTDTGAGAINAAGCGMQIPDCENSRKEKEKLSAAMQV
jgi:hypothetical protein